MPQEDVDKIAAKLFEWGAMAKRMPPSYMGAGITQPIRGTDEREGIGLMLPGEGLYLGHDLKSLGITKPIPYVFEHTKVRRAVDKLQRARKDLTRLLQDEQGSITTYDGIINSRATGNAEDRTFFKATLTTVANNWSSLWQVTGLPVAGTFSATPGVAPNNTTTGAISFSLSTPGSGSKYLLSLGYTSSSAINMLLLVDILSQVGSLSATVNTAQTIASQALTRYTTGAGVMMTCEVTTPIGTTASNLTVTYTNQAGTTNRAGAAQAMTPSMIASRMFPVTFGPFVPMQAGDFGVQQVTKVQLSAAMTAGVFAVELYYPLMWIPGIVANIYVERDSPSQFDGICQMPIGSDSAIGCLGVFVQTTSTASGALVGFLKSCSG